MDRKQIVELLRQQADEIARDGHAGWGNTMIDAADLIEADGEAIQQMNELIAESAGVAGLHLNGDMAPWDSLLPGGRFEEWLHDWPLPTPPGGDHD